MKNIIIEFLLFIKMCLEEKVCKHYFIDTINLFDCLCNPSISKQVNTCIDIIETHVSKKTVLSSLLSRNSKNVLAITLCRDNNFNNYLFFVILFQILNILAILGGAFVFITGLIFILSQVICFIYASLILIPSILILIGLYFVIKTVSKRYFTNIFL